MNTILVIDDDEWLRGSLVATLRGNGFSTIDAGDGTSGLVFAESKKPDLVLCDVNMPDIDGYEVLKQLRAQPATSGIPLILMTGNLEENDLRYSMEQGADDYLPKPIEEQTLLKAVQMRLARKLAVESQAKEVSSRLLAIFDATPSFVTILDASTDQLVYLNPAGRQMLGVGENEPMNQIRVQEFFRDKEDSGSIAKYLEIAKTKGKWVGEFNIVSRLGKPLPLGAQLLAHQMGADKNPWISIVARDLTETIQLRQAHKLEGIGRLASGIAHEINTPIQFAQHNLFFIKEAFATVKGALDVYEEFLTKAEKGEIGPTTVLETRNKVAHSEITELMAEIEGSINDSMQGAERVAKIVLAMKEFSHPGKREGDKAELADLNHAIESTITVARNEWKYVAELATEFDKNLPQVPLIAGEFNQVILNLLVNAAHAVGAATDGGSKGKGTIKVSTHLLDAYAEVRIKDTGTGIPENVRHRIFEPFFTTKEVGVGTGQGLALARSVIAEKHRGQIHFETETGKGTCFIIRLPLKEPKTQKTKKN